MQEVTILFVKKQENRKVSFTYEQGARSSQGVESTLGTTSSPRGPPDLLEPHLLEGYESKLLGNSWDTSSSGSGAFAQPALDV
ncbi:UNVERIFIED_CONTAM: hypothetical protein Sangu_2875300 [Sesamum angustifolium]|uniref:Uncharacterized protein n=1 Tax=Sesamum angustifolium TaxID=2727405 RepID=A0AAW2IPP7_9LAMI